MTFGVDSPSPVAYPSLHADTRASRATMKTLVLGSFALCALSAQVETGVLPPAWNAASADCTQPAQWTVHPYNTTFYILRQSGCSHWEKPFVYLIVGEQRAVLLDTGAGNPKIATAVLQILERHKPTSGRLPLTVIHSHGHGDHTAGDRELAALPGVTVVPPTVSAISEAAAIQSWPQSIGALNLGSRMVDVIPIPGHDAVSIALYDRKTGILLTGDSVYPGRIYVSDMPAYLASLERLVDFTRNIPVAHVLGTHIEQSATPFKDYPIRTQHQLNEHPLELSRSHLLELLTVLREAGRLQSKIVLRDYTIVPRIPVTTRGNRR